jgi:type I restriction enzyme S subunit
VSGADLIGEVPAHWSVKPLRLIGRFLKGTGGSKEDVVENGVPCVRYGDLYTTHNNFIERARTYLTEDRAQHYTAIEYGDVLFAASGETIEEIGKSAVNLLHNARCGGDVVIFRPTEANVARFFGYAMDAAPIAAQKSLAGRGTTVQHIYPDELREVVIAVPPVGEQQIIVDYLDRETARLDALIVAKERVLRLLAEKRRALITRAVTRGLDAHAPVRDSGVSWLGEMPTHWEIRRAAWLFRERDERGETELPLLAVSINTGVVLREFSDERIESTAEDFSTYKVARRGDVAYNKMRMWQGAVGVAPQDGLVSPDYVVAEPIGEFSIGYFGLLFRTGMFSAECARRSHGIVWDRLRLYWEGFREIELPLPPAVIQSQIVAHIDRETAKIDAVGLATERSVTLLKERRTALIATAVIGQLDVHRAVV